MGVSLMVSGADAAVTFGRDKLKGTTSVMSIVADQARGVSLEKVQRSYVPGKFSLEIDGISVDGALRVDGIAHESDIVEYKDGKDRMPLTKPPNHTPGVMTIERTSSSPSQEFIRWRKAVLDGKVERKSISLIFFNDAGEEAGRINFSDCLPLEYFAPSLSSKNSGHATEKLEIAWETMEMK